MPDDFDLQRFVDAQRDTYDRAIDELRRGRKASHWMWFVFPQLRGLGRSETSRSYGIDGIAEARTYAAHPLLGPRLRAACKAILAAPGDAVAILGPIDAVKLRSSMTLFLRAAPDEPVYGSVLDRFFGGQADPVTLELLAEI